MPSLPDKIVAGEIVLVRGLAEDVTELVSAVEDSFVELKTWMPWAQSRPTVTAMREFLETSNDAFERDDEWQYLLRESDGDELVGSAGLRRTSEPTTFEIGYWVRSDRTGRGFATSASRALTDAAFCCVATAKAVEIHMDRANLRSRAVPQKLGYRLDREVDREIETPSHTGRGFVWVMDRAVWSPRAIEFGIDD